MKRVLLSALIAGFGLLVPLDAAAGGVVIHGRVQRPEVLSAIEGETSVVTVLRSPEAAESSGGGGQDQSSDDGGQTLRPRNGLPHPIDPIEFRQIQAGLITEEEALSGCGGASAAAGPAGLFPLLVAAAAVARMRRRR